MSGFRFQETMVGRVTPWSQDTALGYTDPGAFSATLRAFIDIADLDLFIARDLPHRAAMTVELDVPVLSGRPFETYDGVFELFRSGDNPSGRRGFHMVYDGFLGDGQRVFMMRGRKYLSPGRPFGVWRETTTMRVILRDVTHGGMVDVVTAARGISEPVHEPSWQRDFARPLFLSGTVSLTVGALIEQVRSMTALDTPWYAKPFRIVGFIGFFATSLVRIYVFRSRP